MSTVAVSGSAWSQHGSVISYGGTTPESLPLLKDDSSSPNTSDSWVHACLPPSKVLSGKSSNIMYRNSPVTFSARRREVRDLQDKVEEARELFLDEESQCCNDDSSPQLISQREKVNIQKRKARSFKKAVERLQCRFPNQTAFLLDMKWRAERNASSSSRFTSKQ